MGGHTHTPWGYRRAKFPSDGEFDCGIHADIGGTPFCIAETFGRCATTIKLDAEANAAFIVTACNSHADLVKALEFYATGGGTATIEAIAIGDVDLARASETLTEDCGDVARAALAKLPPRNTAERLEG
jgi:hypothetical protein